MHAGKEHAGCEQRHTPLLQKTALGRLDKGTRSSQLAELHSDCVSLQAFRPHQAVFDATTTSGQRPDRQNHKYKRYKKPLICRKKGKGGVR